MAEQSSGLRDFWKQMRIELGISDDFAEASNHPASCRCQKCLDWWANMPEEEPDSKRKYPSAPFTDTEIITRQKELGIE